MDMDIIKATPSIGALVKALAQARLATPWFVSKGGFNQHSRYSFVGHPDVMAHDGRRVLAEHGLVLLQTLVRYAGEAPGTKATTHLWDGEYLLAHESGESLTLRLQATTQANDKTAFVASTALDRTIHLRVLNLAGSDDEDPDGAAQAPQCPPQLNEREREAQARAHQRAATRDGAADAAPNPDVAKVIAALETATGADIQTHVDAANALRPNVPPTAREAMRAAVEQARKRISIAAARAAATTGSKAVAP